MPILFISFNSVLGSPINPVENPPLPLCNIPIVHLLCSIISKKYYGRSLSFSVLFLHKVELDEQNQEMCYYGSEWNTGGKEEQGSSLSRKDVI